MTTLRTAAQQALEALEYHVEQTRPIHRTSEAITALRAALAQQDEPVQEQAEPMQQRAGIPLEAALHKAYYYTEEGKWRGTEAREWDRWHAVAKAAVALIRPERSETREHVTDGTPCWCGSEAAYTDPDTGASVILHKRPQ